MLQVERHRALYSWDSHALFYTVAFGELGKNVCDALEWLRVPVVLRLLDHRQLESVAGSATSDLAYRKAGRLTSAHVRRNQAFTMSSCSLSSVIVVMQLLALSVNCCAHATCRAWCSASARNSSSRAKP